MRLDLSIVIPAYNCQNCIEKAVESVLRTEKIQYEIIIINDCSTDNTEEILKRYNNNNKVVVINLEKNHGVSYCRNLGIKKSQGNYICFLDADDYIEKGMYEDLISRCYKENLDICVCGHYIVNKSTGNKMYSKYNRFGTFKNGEIVKMLLLDYVSPAPYDKVFKKEKIQKFNENLKVGEDFLFCLENFFYSEKVKIVNKNYYNYIQNENSTMHSFNNNLEQICIIDKYIPNEILEVIQKKFSNEFNFFKLRNITRYVNSISNISNKNNRNLVKEKIKKYLTKRKVLEIIRYKELNRFIRIEMLIILIFGIDIHLRLIPLYKRLREILLKEK